MEIVQITEISLKMACKYFMIKLFVYKKIYMRIL